MAIAIVGDVAPAMAAVTSMVLSLSKRPSRPLMMPFMVVLTNGTVPSRPSPAASSTPTDSASFTDTSKIAASISTCRRRTSNWLTVDSNWLVVAGSARMMSAFRDSSAWMFATGAVVSPPALARLLSNSAVAVASAWLR